MTMMKWIVVYKEDGKWCVFPEVFNSDKEAHECSAGLAQYVTRKMTGITVTPIRVLS